AVALGLDATNTGYDGAVAQGLYAGTPSQWTDLDLNQSWLDTNNGGSTIVEGLDVTGSLSISVPNLTLRYCKVHDMSPTANYLVDNVPWLGSGSGAGVTCEYCTFDGGLNTSKSFLGIDFTLDRCLVIGNEDGVHMTHDVLATSGSDYGIVRECFIHSQTHDGAAGQHSDCVQIWSKGTLVIERSRLIAPQRDQNACLQMADASDVRVQDCYLFGGGFVYQGSPAGTLHSWGNMVAYDSYAFGVYTPDLVSLDAAGDVWWGWEGSIPLIDTAGNPEAPSPPASPPANGTPIPPGS
ncbi:MAG: hypothetical protein D6683_04235, partial [Actinomyces sp.]